MKFLYDGIISYTLSDHRTQVVWIELARLVYGLIAFAGVMIQI